MFWRISKQNTIGNPWRSSTRKICTITQFSAMRCACGTLSVSCPLIRLFSKPRSIWEISIYSRTPSERSYPTLYYWYERGTPSMPILGTKKGDSRECKDADWTPRIQRRLVFARKTVCGNIMSWIPFESELWICLLNLEMPLTHWPWLPMVKQWENKLSWRNIFMIHLSTSVSSQK